MSVFAKAAVAALAVRDGTPAGLDPNVPAAIAAMGAPLTPPTSAAAAPAASSSGQ